MDDSVMWVLMPIFKRVGRHMRPGGGRAPIRKIERTEATWKKSLRWARPASTSCKRSSPTWRPPAAMRWRRWSRWPGASATWARTASTTRRKTSRASSTPASTSWRTSCSTRSSSRRAMCPPTGWPSAPRSLSRTWSVARTASSGSSAVRRPTPWTASSARTPPLERPSWAHGRASRWPSSPPPGRSSIR